MLNKIDTTKILIHLNNSIYINYSNIISLLEPNDIIDTKWFKSKKLVYSKKNIKEPKSYIYCKDNFIIATSIDVKSLKEKIEETISSFYNNNIFTE